MSKNEPDENGLYTNMQVAEIIKNRMKRHTVKYYALEAEHKELQDKYKLLEEDNNDYRRTYRTERRGNTSRGSIGGRAGRGRGIFRRK